ncbi:MAG: glutamate-1-semialdehyde 2,1-aminomutase, partial [Reyranella sp.]|nr:glutamate-1-semialdehyde 2,1-aminomutase [Reyranella sp.]
MTMDLGISSALGLVLAVSLLALLAVKARARLALSRAKHRSLGGHSRLSRRIAALVPNYSFDDTRFFRADDASTEIAGRRRAEFERLSHLFRTRYQRTLEQTKEAARHISDLQFTESYRVPFQFSRLAKASFPMGSFLASSEGVMVTDLDGNASYDLTGSYGVILLGYDFYKA